MASAPSPQPPVNSPQPPSLQQPSLPKSPPIESTGHLTGAAGAPTGTSTEGLAVQAKAAAAAMLSQQPTTNQRVVS
eukprot:11169335-Karenia_brevis.AAC.1